MNLKRLVLVLWFALLLTACEDAEADLFVDLALDWAHEKDLVACANAGDDPATCEVELTPTFVRWAAGESAEQFTSDVPLLNGLGELAGAVLKPDLDEGAEAVLETAKTAKEIAEADSLAEEGFAAGDPEKIQQAIAMRENDWSYDEMLAVVYLAKGDSTSAADAQNQAEEKTRDYLSATLASEGLEQGDEQAYAACVTAYGNLYAQRESALLTQINTMMDADPPQDADALIGQLDLVRSEITRLEQNSQGSPCRGYGPGG